MQEVESADIVAMTSRPTYDPYNIAAYLDDENGAMRNKAFASFSSGSSFKIVVTAAALESGIEFEDEYECTGFYDAGSNIISCGETDGHGKINLEQAFASSCNTYFCNLAQQVGPERILAMAKKFGFGASTSFWEGYETEAGNLPDLQDLSAPAALANFAIGQGVLQVTPVQIMNMSSVIANDGILKSPNLIYGFADENGEVSPADYAGRDVRVCQSPQPGKSMNICVKLPIPALAFSLAHPLWRRRQNLQRADRHCERRKECSAHMGSPVSFRQTTAVYYLRTGRGGDFRVSFSGSSISADCPIK